MTKLTAMIQKARQQQAGDRRWYEGDHLVVEALAGTGKTFTLVVGLAFIFRKQIPGIWKLVVDHFGFNPEDTASPQQAAVWAALEKPHISGRRVRLPKFITYVAFNKSIVQEFSAKYQWLVAAFQAHGIKLTFSTCHSLGYSAVRKAWDVKGNPNKFKTDDILESILGRDLREVVAKSPKMEVQIQAVRELVKHAKNSLVDSDHDELAGLAAHHLIEMGDQEQVFKLVGQVLEESLRWSHTVDFSDMIWVPNMLDLKVFRSNLLLGDEAQDWNSAQQGVILKAAGRGVISGDTFQAIYGWAGADVDSIPNMTKRMGLSGTKVHTLPLTMTRRCGKAIVREAQKIVPAFEAHESNPEGEILDISSDKAREMVKDSDMILCRTNAPLVAWAFRLIRQGKKANIQGRDLGQGLISLVEKLAKKGAKRSRGCSISKLTERIMEWADQEEAKIRKDKKPNEEALIRIQDHKACLLIFTEGAKSVKEVTKAIERAFQGLVCPKCGKHYDESESRCGGEKTRYRAAWGCGGVILEKPEGILLSSIHRSKGLEADRVFLLRPDLLPHPMAKQKWARRQETHLEYVAKTRAIQTLAIVEPDPKEDE